MTTPFNDPVVGGQGALIRQWIKSPDYVPGVSGWQIARDGSAEFNNLVIRGTFFGLNFEINQSGAFFYSGVPAAGNLVMSFAQTGGSDSFGNPYDAGVEVGSSAGVQALVAIVSGHGVFKTPLNNALFNQDPQVIGAIGAGTSGAFGQLTLKGAVHSGKNDSASITLNSSDSVSDANGELLYDPAGAPGPIEYGFWDSTGFNMIGNATGAIPGTSPAVNDNWNLMTTINGWSWAGSPEAEPFYKALAAPERAIQVVGRITHAAITGNSTFWSVPAAYQNVNSTAQIFGSCIINNATNAYPTQATQAKMRLAGSALEFVGLPAGTTDVSFEGYYFLDI